MSLIDEVEKRKIILYRNHDIERSNNKFICKDCKLNAWEADFPEYCSGPYRDYDISKLGYADFKLRLYLDTKKMFLNISDQDLNSVKVELDKESLCKIINNLEGVIKEL